MVRSTLLSELKFPAAITVVEVRSPCTSLTFGIPGSAIAMPTTRRARAMTRIPNFFMRILLKFMLILSASS
jgi:hypothetical protein